MGFPFKFDTSKIGQVVQIEPLPPAQPPSIRPPTRATRLVESAQAASEGADDAGDSALVMPSGLPSAPVLPTGAGTAASPSFNPAPFYINMQLTNEDIRQLVETGILDVEIEADFNYTNKKHPILKAVLFALRYDAETGEIFLDPMESDFHAGVHCDQLLECIIHDGDKRVKSALKAKATDDPRVRTFGENGILERHYDSTKDKGDIKLLGHYLGGLDG